MSKIPFTCPTCLRGGVTHGIRALCPDVRCPDRRNWVLTPQGWVPDRARGTAVA